MRPHDTDARDEDHAWPDRRIAELAARQATIVTTSQLRGLGVAPRTIMSASQRGRLHRVHRGVHSLVLPSGRPRLAAEWAALLACGVRAILSHLTAAWLQGLIEERPRGEVTLTVVGTDRRHPGIHIHRVPHLHDDEQDRRSRLPVTSVARVVLDLAPIMELRAFERLLDRALQRTSAVRLRAIADRHPGRPGSARVRALLDPARPSADTRSRQERRLLELIRAAGLPLPEANVAVGLYTPDLLWRQLRVIVEYDSDAFHSGPSARHRDAERHNHFTSLGYLVIHVTTEELAHHRVRIVAQIAAALARAER